MVPLAAGLGIGLVAAWFLSRLLDGVLYEISGADPATYIAAGALLLGIGAAASTRPAWRTAADGPLRARRME